MAAGKVIAVLTVLAFSYLAYEQYRSQMTQSSDLAQLWTSWKAQYAKSYATIDEDHYRFGVFSDNVARIQKWNSENRGSIQALNKFGDLTGDEFKTTYASCSGTPEEMRGVQDEYCPSASNCPTLPATNVTATNWTAKGAVTGVKNQEQCGSCWAFSTTGCLEGLYFLNHSLLLSFSEQQIVDCASNCQGCDGCFPYLALEYTATNGNEPEAVYPYKGVQGKCQYKSALAVKANTGYQCVEQKSVSQLMSALVQQPVSIGVEADQNAWQFYSTGVVNDGCGDALDHAVLLTGAGPYNGGDTAWYVKNSWGTDWGMNGYIWIGQDDSQNGGFGVCGILRCGTLPVNS